MTDDVFITDRLAQRGLGHLAPTIIAEAEAARKVAEAAYRRWNAEFRQRMAVYPQLPEPKLRPAKIAYTYRPTRRQGLAMALDCGFDPHVVGIDIAVPAAADAAAASAEFAAALAANRAEYKRREAETIRQMEAEEWRQPQLSGCFSLTFFLTAEQRRLCRLQDS